MSPVVVVIVVFMIPVALVVGPTAVVVVIVGVGPIRTGIRRSPPDSGYPDIASPVPVPITIYPRIAGTRDRRTPLITRGRRAPADIHADTRESRRGKSRSQNCTH